MSPTESFSFRLRFIRCQRSTVNVESPEWVLPNPIDEHNLVLASRDKEISIKQSSILFLRSDGWPTAESAEASGKLYGDAFQRALVRLRIGADFGRRAPKSGFFRAGLEMLENRFGQRVLNDVHGLMVFETNPPPKFVSTNVTAVLGIQQERFEEVFEAAVRQGLEISDRESLSIELFNGSFFQETEDTRFLLLFMAIEALLEPADRSAQALAHVDSIIRQTDDSASLSNIEKASLMGSLEWLRKESINQTGKKLAAKRLGSRVYMDRPAADFFSYCHKIRSRIVHGVNPQPERNEFGPVAAQLEVFVSDLLSGPLLVVEPKD